MPPGIVSLLLSCILLSFHWGIFNPTFLHHGRLDLIIPKSRLVDGVWPSFVLTLQSQQCQNPVQDILFLFISHRQSNSILSVGEVRKSLLTLLLLRRNKTSSTSPKVALHFLNQFSSLLQLLCRLCLIPRYLVYWQTIYL